MRGEGREMRNPYNINLPTPAMDLLTSFSTLRRHLLINRKSLHMRIATVRRQLIFNGVITEERKFLFKDVS